MLSKSGYFIYIAILCILTSCSNNIHGIWEFTAIKDENKVQKEIDSIITKLKNDTTYKGYIDLNKPTLINKSYHNEHIYFFGLSSWINHGKGYYGFHGSYTINKDSVWFNSASDLVFRSWIDYNSEHFYNRLVWGKLRFNKINKDTLILINKNGDELIYVKWKEKRDPAMNKWEWFLYIVFREFQKPEEIK